MPEIIDPLRMANFILNEITCWAKELGYNRQTLRTICPPLETQCLFLAYKQWHWIEKQEARTIFQIIASERAGVNLVSEHKGKQKKT